MRRALQTAFATAVLAGAAALVAAPAGAGQDNRIVGGQVASPGEYPGLVSLSASVRGEEDPGFTHQCGGTLIGPTTVLTASHCVAGTTPDEWDVIVGREDLSDTSTGERIPVLHYTTHPGSADVAILELARPASAEPTPLATSEDEALFGPGTTATAAGWGMKSETQGPSDDIREVDVPIVSDSSCLRAYRDFGGMHMQEMICAGEKGKDTCAGDSGGPLYVHDAEGNLLQVGITSFGQGCGREGFPGVYTEIPAVLDFITDPDPVWAPIPESGRAKIRGTAKVGGRLRCDEGEWSGEDVEFRYTWTAGYNPRPISHERSIKPGSKLAGKKLSCSVVGMNRGGFVDLASGTVRVHGDGN